MSLHRKPWKELLLSGVLSALCYALLYAYEPEIVANFMRTDGLYPMLPVVTAFVFSFAHGAFTGYFWEVIGIRARPRPKDDSAKLTD